MTTSCTKYDLYLNISSLFIRLSRPSNFVETPQPIKLCNNPNSALGGIDIDIETVWDEYSGLGVTLGIIDDGIDYTHPDIVQNYNQSIDYDALDEVLGLGSDDPMSDGLDDFHGTAVAGVMAGSFGGGEVFVI